MDNLPKHTRKQLLNSMAGASYMLINKNLLQLFGMETATYLSYLIDKSKYFEEHKNDEDYLGWFYLKNQTVIKHLNTSKYILAKMRNTLELCDLLQVKITGTPKKIWYKLDLQKLWDLMYVDLNDTGLSKILTINSQKIELLIVKIFDYIYNNNRVIITDKEKKINKKNLDQKNKQIETTHFKRTKLPSKKEENNIDHLIKLDKIHPLLFDNFYEQYPKKVGKQKALTSWNNLCKNNSSLKYSTIIDALKLQAQSHQWKDKQFIPHPTTWLNQKRWEDDAEVYKTITQSKSIMPKSSANFDPDSQLNQMYKRRTK